MTTPAPAPSLVVMGVSGCGKSSVAAEIATALEWPLVEGDEFHPPSNRDKMSRGIALTDADRQGWLSTLADELRARRAGAVLTCSALKRAYRDRLREGRPDVLFLWLDLSRDAALQRVSGRAGHFFSASLVDDQFATLEPPTAEPGVLRVDATRPIAELRDEAVRWVRSRVATRG